MARFPMVAGIALVLAAWTSAGAEEKVTLRTGSRAPYVHRISLYDAGGEVIAPENDSAPPYSPGATCGKCHDYGTISSGWHFNSADPKAAPGRPGEPWLLTDLTTRTQLPVSTRPWPGAYRPADVGLTPWRLTLLFGRHMPGGGIAEKFPEKPEDPKARWKVSGKLEIHCASCHSADARLDQGEWAKQIEEQNFRWASVASDGLAIVRGSAKKLPDTFDPMAEADPAAASPAGLKVLYDAKRFDADGRVVFDIARRPSAERCYFCHSSREAGVEDEWDRDTDVHLSSGLTCVDCHRNGLDHAIARGSEQEGAATAKVSTLSCKGCHEAGRLGSPLPRHRGVPTTHLEKLSCTACHSGPMPADAPRSVRTSRAHGLGIASLHRRDDVPPFVAEPVYLRQADGRIAPHRMVWPAFWGRMKGDAVSPMAPEAVIQTAAEALGGKVVKEEDWKPLTEEQIGKALEALSAQKDDAGEAVYVCGGKLYRRSADGKLSGAEHKAAEPYAWPIAHDVRPSAQSLGSRGCTECHARDAAFLFGKVTAQSPAQVGAPAQKAMYEVEGLALKDAEGWMRSAQWRDTFVCISLVAAAVLAIVLGSSVVLGVGAVLRALCVRKPRGAA